MPVPEPRLAIQYAGQKLVRLIPLDSESVRLGLHRALFAPLERPNSALLQRFGDSAPRLARDRANFFFAVGSSPIALRSTWITESTWLA